MTAEHCWSLQSDGARCEEPAVAGSYFCAGHNAREGGVHPMSIWRAPEAEMPPDLLALIRRYAPDVTFPAAKPPVPAIASPVSAAEKQGDEEPSTTPTTCSPSPSVSPSLRGEVDPMGWLMAVLQEVTTGLMASEATPLQKANAVARLGGLYLRAHRAAELEKENKKLARRIAELEKQAAAAEVRAADLESRARVWSARLGETDPASLKLHPGPLTPMHAHAPAIAAAGHGRNGRADTRAKASRSRPS